MSVASWVSNGTGVRVQPPGQGDLGSTGAACHHDWPVRWVWEGDWGLAFLVIETPPVAKITRVRESGAAEAPRGGW